MYNIFLTNSTVVEHQTHNPMFVGSNPAAAGIGRKYQETMNVLS
jgi:hypothetical protein